MSGHKDPGETFIGVGIGTDPFTLLGLPREPADEATVLAALGARMTDIADHRRSHTPEANEMRLALHAAAAQLLDPQLQELLLHASADPEAQERPQSPAHKAEQRPVTPKPQASSIQSADHIRHDVLLVVAANGGWNNAAMRRIALLAHARGIPSHELPAVVSSVLTMGAVPQAVTDLPESAGTTRTGSIAGSAAVDKKRSARAGSLFVSGVFAFLTVVSLLLVWARLTGDGAAVTPQVDSATSKSLQSTQESPAPTQTKQETPVRELSANAAARQLSAIANSNETLDQEKLAELSRIHRAISAKWVGLDTDFIVSIHNSILEIVYSHSSDTDTVLEYIEILSADSHLDPTTQDNIARATWSIGTLARLSMERNLPTSVDAAIIGHLVSFPGDSSLESAHGFNEGSLAALDAFASQMAKQQSQSSTWEGWIDALEAVCADNKELVIQHRLMAIETLAVEGAEPNQSRQVFDAFELLCEGIVLDNSDQAAEKLVQWLGDDRISSADLSVITRVLISKSRTSGIDESLVLSSSADPTQRMAVRTSLEQLLLGVDAGSTEAIAEWMSIANQETLRTSQGSASDILLRAITRSRLSSAAKAIFWGDYQASRQTLANISDDLQRISNSGTSSPKQLGGDSSIDWATRYLSARQNIPVRQALLSELTRGQHTLGPVAAETLVKDAFFGTPATIRAEARDVVRLYSRSPAVVNAVLEYLPRIPQIDSSSDVIESLVYGFLPAASDPNWSFKARQLLTDALLNLISGQGEGEIVDRLVAELAASYKLRLSNQAVDQSLEPAEYLEQASYQLYEQWATIARAQINDLSLLSRINEVEMKRIGRASLSDGIIAGFAANQVSAVEVMAIVLQAENVSKADHIESIIASMSKERREANSILEQISIVEYAAVELWKIRLGGGLE